MQPQSGEPRGCRRTILELLSVADQHRMRTVVWSGELHFLSALFGKRHACDDHVVFVIRQALNDLGPGDGDKRAINGHLLAKRFGDIDVETSKLTGCILKIKWRVCALRRDSELFIRRREINRACEKKYCCKCEPADHLFPHLPSFEHVRRK